jgi:hypothetical protein
LAYLERVELRLGAQGLHSELRLRQQRVPIARPFGLLLEIATPVPLRGLLADRLAVGAALHLTPRAWLTVQSPSSTTPIFPYYANRTQRLVAMPALALRLWRGLAVGVGLNYFAGVRGHVYAFDGASGELQADVEQEFLGVATPHAGVRLRQGALNLGLTYRSQFSVPVELHTEATLADATMALDVEATALFTPETWVVAAAYRLGEVELSADLSWRRWSRYRTPFARVQGTVPVPLSQTGETFDVAGDRGEQTTHDVPRLAVGVTWQLAAAWRLAAGYSFEPSPFAASRGVENLIDGSKQIAGLGVFWRGPTLGRLDWGVDLATQLQHVGRRRLTKDPAELPDEDPDLAGVQTSNLGYPTIAGGGIVFAASACLVLALAPEETP